MRNIKFRAWDKKFKKLFMVESIDFENKFIMMSCDRASSTSSSFSNCILEQYTGLKDKNDVEIYEGDIISDGQKASVVKFDKIGYDGSFNGMTGFYLSGYENEDFDDETMFLELRYHFNIREFEVVGNIHE